MSADLNRRDLLLTAGVAAAVSAPGPLLAQNAPGESVPKTQADTSGVPSSEKKINIVTLRDLESEAQGV